MEKIGLGIITYNAPEKIKQSAFSVPQIVDEFIIVNDGTPYSDKCYPENAHVLQHSQNMKVAKSKNDALNYLVKKGCEHIFLMEDDVIIKDPLIFERYIEASQKSGILHLNFALQGPLNFKKFQRDIKDSGDLSDRIFNEIDAEPNPLYTKEYQNRIQISFYPACVGAFSYFRKEVIENVGYFDEMFKNSWEHVEHTYRIIQAGYHPPFGWFADISDSNNYLANIPNCMDHSTIAKDPNWKTNSLVGESYFKKLHGKIPGKIKKASLQQLSDSLVKISQSHKDLNLLIKFPTRGRREKFFQVLDKYISFIEDKDNYQIVVSCDHDDITMNNPEVLSKIKTYKSVKIHFNNNKSKIEAVNADMDIQENYDIILLASDDMIPVEKGFDRIIKENIRKHFPDLDGVVWFNDGYQGNALNTLCILGKKYYERFNYIYHPAYKSLWCDNEFTHVADKLNKQVYIDKVIIKHEHPASNTNIQEDELYEKNLKLDSVDRVTYEKRKKENFGLKKLFLIKERLKSLWISK